MDWCLPGDKPLYKPMMVSLLTHICVTRPQWVYNMAAHDLASCDARPSAASHDTDCEWHDIDHVTLSFMHDDVIKWKHFPRHWPFVRGIHWSPVNSPHKGQWRGALIFSLICSWINGWVNNGEASDLTRHGTHYDVIVMENFDNLSVLQNDEKNQIYFYVPDINSALRCLYKLWSGEPTEGNRFLMNNNNVYSDRFFPFNMVKSYMWRWHIHFQVQIKFEHLIHGTLHNVFLVLLSLSKIINWCDLNVMVCMNATIH